MLFAGVGSGVVLVMPTVLVRLPAGALLTVTTIVNVPETPLASEAAVAVTLVAPTTGLNVSVPALNCADAVYSVMPTPSTSVMVSAFALLGPRFVKVTMYEKVPPTVPTDTLAVLVTAKLALAVTLSTSPAEQTPATVQEVDGLVLVTFAGGVITAVLVTDVCATATDCNAKLRPSTVSNTGNTRVAKHFKDKSRPKKERKKIFNSHVSLVGDYLFSTLQKVSILTYGCPIPRTTNYLRGLL